MACSVRIGLFAALAVGFAGCSVLPSTGPSGKAVQQSSSVALKDEGRLGSVLMKVSPLVISLTKQSLGAPAFSRSAQRRKFSDVRIGVGDKLDVSVFEANTGGMFNPSAGGGGSSNSISLPLQQVDAKGLISVPYAGQIQAAGRTTEDVKADIESKLKNRAIEPQVVVTLKDRRSGAISVSGDVGKPTTFTLEPGGAKLLEAIARAGGTKFESFEMLVTLDRRGRIEQVPLISVIRDPAQNIYLEQGDSIVLSREPRSFVVLGATPAPGSTGGQNNRRFLFESENISLTEAVAKAGGLLTREANARAVFIYRQESREVLSRVGVDVSSNPALRIPTIYQVDLTEAQGYFLASELYVRDRDVIFIADSPIFQATKAFAVITPLIRNSTQIAGFGSFGSTSTASNADVVFFDLDVIPDVDLVPLSP